MIDERHVRRAHRLERQAAAAPSAGRPVAELWPNHRDTPAADGYGAAVRLALTARVCVGWVPIVVSSLPASPNEDSEPPQMAGSELDCPISDFEGRRRELAVGPGPGPFFSAARGGWVQSRAQRREQLMVGGLEREHHGSPDELPPGSCPLLAPPKVGVATPMVRQGHGVRQAEHNAEHAADPSTTRPHEPEGSYPEGAGHRQFYRRAPENVGRAGRWRRALDR
jgi:hypothetical protein